MRTAVDTNVFSIIWRGADEATPARRQLLEARRAGSIVISPITYAELLADPKLSAIQVEHLLEEADVVIDFDLGQHIWKDAGLRFARYSERRKQSGGGGARRLLADFIVGSHALHACHRLMTFDTRRFRADYPELRLVEIVNEPV